MNDALAQFEVVEEPEIVRLRLDSRTIAARLGFEARGQAEVASAVSMVARDVSRQFGLCQVDFRIGGDPPRSLVVRVVAQEMILPDSKPSLSDFEPQIHQLMDSWALDNSNSLAITLVKSLPTETPAVSPSDLSRIVEDLRVVKPESTVDDLIRQDQELLQALDDCEAKTRELTELSRELAETNRAILALDVELHERTESLRRASEIKRRFLSKVSHELRTPLASILSLTHLLMDRADGELTDEQERQVSFIARAAGDLSGMVNDLLDLARIDAGREVVRPSEIHLPEFFAILRGMFRPQQWAGSPVTLVFEAPVGLPPLWTDGARLTQILHNFLTNALKFTESGEVRVKAEAAPGDRVIFSVTDPGIGIESDQLERVFEEFGQVDSPLQRRAKGTGLGLPLANKLARLLGGRVDVRSEPGVGSTFTATIPIRFNNEPSA